MHSVRAAAGMGRVPWLPLGTVVAAVVLLVTTQVQGIDTKIVNNKPTEVAELFQTKPLAQDRIRREAREIVNNEHLVKHRWQREVRDIEATEPRIQINLNKAFRRRREAYNNIAATRSARRNQRKTVPNLRGNGPMPIRRRRDAASAAVGDTAIVEEVFGRSAVIDADESRRIYAISIPRIFQDERPIGGSSSSSGGYHPPVYRTHTPPDRGYRGGTRMGDYPPGGGGLHPPVDSYTDPRSPSHWKSGLRLIVSGPAEDQHPPKSFSSESRPSYEYDSNPESFNYRYDSPYDAVDRPYETEPPRDDRNRKQQWQDYNDKPSYPNYQQKDDRTYTDDVVPDHKQEKKVYDDKEDKTNFFNRPYHKLPEPYSVVDGEPSNVKTEKNENTDTVPYADAEEALYYGDTEEDLKPPSADHGDPRNISPPQEYYDTLYEEFMEAAYDDYYDHLDIGPHDKDLQTDPSKPGKIEGTGGNQFDDTQDKNIKNVRPKSETRRHPPSDMYTTSRSTVTPKYYRPNKPEESKKSQSPSEDLSAQHEEESTENIKNEETLAPHHYSTTPVDAPPSPLPNAPSSSATPAAADDSATTESSQVPKPNHPYKQRPVASLISLSEILQGIGISLPQFLVQLKIHGSDLKKFTAKLERRALTKLEFKRAQGNVGELLSILDEISSETQPLTTTNQYLQTTTKPTFRRLNHGYTRKTTIDITTTNPVSSTTTQKSTASTTNSISTTHSTTSSTEITSTTKNTPKMFGFRPSATIKKDGAETNPTNISITSSKDPTEDVINNSKKDVGEEANSSEESELLTYRPYRPEGGGWRERMKHNRGVVSRLGTTTRRPTVRPNYVSFGGGNPALQDLIDSQDEGSAKNIESNDAKSGDILKNQNKGFGLFNSDSTVIGLTEGTPMGGRYDHPRYDRDPNSLNIATRSAIMAAGVLGGIALAVFLTILIFVMYRNHVGRRRLRIPFPLSVSSDDSTSSTPPLYSTRSRSGIGTRSSKHTDFWGTLKRKFDPYSLGSTTASYY